MSYIQSLVEHLCPLLSCSASLYTTLPFPRCLFSGVILLPLYRSLPCRGARSRYAAGAVLNSDSSDSRAAVSCRSIKE